MTNPKKITMDDLTQLSLPELKDLSKMIETAKAKVAEDTRKKALAELEARAQEMGFSLSELTGGKGAKAPKAKGVPKYAHPADPTQTWSGRGRRPAWVYEWVEAGKDLEDLAL